MKSLDDSKKELQEKKEEVSVETLDFSELSELKGGKVDVGCSAIFSGSCKGTPPERNE